MAQASLEQPKMVFALPLHHQKREAMEHELAKKLASGKQVVGGIFLTSRANQFEYIKCEGDTEIPLIEQFPMLKSHDRDLGPKRRETRTIYFVKANTGHHARLFVRVLAGCEEVQINGCVQYLNFRLDGPNFTFPGISEQCDSFLLQCRDILYPGFRYFTRGNKLKPWVWVPITWPPVGAVVSLADVVHGGCVRTAVEAPIPKESDRWPAITLVRRSDTNTVHTLGEMSKCVPADAILGEVENSNFPEAAKNDNVDVITDVVEEEVVTEAAKDDEPPATNSNDNVKDKEFGETALVVPEAEAQSKAQDEARDPPSKTAVHSDNSFEDGEGESDAIEEVNFEDADDEVKSCATSIDDDVDDDVFGDSKKKATNEQQHKADKGPAEKRDENLPDYNDEEEEILSGFLDIQKPKENAVQDDRPVTLRRLHMALPKSKSDIPNGLKQKLAFSLLVLEIRTLEDEYNATVGIDKDLPKLDEAKTLNQREVKREMKHLLELMCERDRWESDQRVAGVKKVIEKKSKKLTKAERKKQAEKYEQLEKERLVAAAKEKLADGTPPELKSVDVENGPRYKGLGGFAMYLRQSKQQEENSRRKKELDRLKKLAGAEVPRNDSMASSTGSVKPLSSVLTKQTEKSKRAKARPQAPGLTDNELQEEIDNIGLMLDDMADQPQPQPSTSGSSGKREKSKDKTLDESVFVKPGVPRGYVKADTLKLMKEMYKQQCRLITSNEKQFSEIKAQVKSLDNRQKRTEAVLEKTGQKFGRMQKAFFDYDIQANQELCDVETEFMAYFPLDQLGERTDFVFTDPACAKTIVKRVQTRLHKEGTRRHNLSLVVNETARVCFSYRLRAHMHIVKRQWKESVGWWKVKCPSTFQLMMEKYVIPLAAKLDDPEANGQGWKKILYTHFKNTGDTYFEIKGKKTTSQPEFVKVRHLERIRLQELHFIEEVEDRELKVPKLSQEMASYAKHSERFDHAGEMNDADKSQKNRGSQDEDEEEKLSTPLPDLDQLHQLSKRLKLAIDASVLARKKQKRKIAVEDMVDNEDDSDDSSEEEVPPKKAKKAKKSSDRKSSDETRKKKSTAREPSPSSSSNSSFFENSEDTSSSSDDYSAFKSNASKFNFDSTLDRTSVQASASSANRKHSPGGKPKAYASFMTHPPRKTKLQTRKRKAK